MPVEFAMNRQEPTVDTTSEVMHCYVQLASKVAKMVQLAKDKNWGALPDAEARCAAIVARLQVIEPTQTLSPTEMAEARRLIACIQSDQATVSSIVKPQLEQLVENMSALQARKSLDKAYRTSH
jgi:flagellar protein FliT